MIYQINLQALLNLSNLSLFKKEIFTKSIIFLPVADIFVKEILDNLF